MLGLKEQRVDCDKRGPLILQPHAGCSDLSTLLHTQAAELESRLLDAGAILFRGFDVRETAQFEQVVAAISSTRLNYTYRSTPRTCLGRDIYTTTEYPPDREIPLHNENAYQRDWPLKLAFCCLVPASSGGETPLADMRSVSAAVGTELLEKFEARGVRYVRHYRPYSDLPWQTVFQTDDRAELARFCAVNAIAHEWIDTDILRTSQSCQGVAYHPVTRERLLFNQAHLFHVSSLAPAQSALLLTMFGSDLLPRHAYFGDGENISPPELEIVRAAFRAAEVRFAWEAGDVLLLDNMLMAHGRRPFTGPRRHLAALLDPFSASSRATYRS